ncbi:hypothetical protein H0H92_007958 [Tricholoma furcatifolium]|nr:hypothetical protein H0H92_007958 [Tricholoma furcatifolium]
MTDERAPYLPSSDIYLSSRLGGQHGCIDKLSLLFEQLQLVTIEASDPCLDLLAFAEEAYYFAVIMKEIKSPSPEEDPMTQAQAQKTTDNENAGVRVPTPPVAKVAVDFLLQTSAAAVPRRRRNNRRKAKSDNASAKAARFPASVELFDDDSSGDDIRSESHTSSGRHRDNDAFSDSDSPPPDDILSWDPPIEEAVGLVYLYDLAKFTDPLRQSELNIGIILDPAHRGNGYATQAVRMVLEEAFGTAQWHRVQAIIPDHVDKYPAFCLFTKMGFGYEGTRRRAFYSPIEGVYKDVTYMGMLDTQWMLEKAALVPEPKSVWDQLFMRQTAERDELVRWEESVGRVQTPRQRNSEPVKLDEGIDGNAAKGKATSEWVETGWSAESESCGGYESDASTTISAASLSGYESTASSGSWDVI